MRFPSRAFAAILAASCLAVGLAASAAQAAAPAWLPIAASGPTNLPPVQSEVQRVAVDAEGGSYTLSFDGQTTAPIAFDATTAQLREALEELSNLEPGDVAVSGGPGDKGATSPYFVTFGDALADTDVPQMSADSGGLTGGINSTAMPSTAINGGPGTAEITIYPQNVGGIPSFGTTTLKFTLPDGVRTTAAPIGNDWECADPKGPNRDRGTCHSTKAIEPGFTVNPLIVPVRAEPGAAGGPVQVEVTGGGALGLARFEMPLLVSAIPAPPGLQSFTAGAYRDNGEIDTRAGAHPYSASAGLLVNTVRAAGTGHVVPAGELRDIVVDTPPGFIGNPVATAQCPESFAHEDCPPEAIVATVQIVLRGFSTGAKHARSPVYNVEPPYGFPARFRFLTGSDQILINVVASLRSDEDYGLEVGSYDTPQIQPVFGSFFTIWGTPADSGHDGQRCTKLEGAGAPSGCVEGGEEIAFLTNPVDCAEEALRAPMARVNVNTWQNPGFLFAGEVALEPVTECEKLKFDADFEFEPSGAKAADSPASFSTELKVPSEGLTKPGELMTPTIRESVVDLPEGVVLNASAADGLAACSFAQIGYKGKGFPRPNEIRFTKQRHSCPDASKIGSGEVKSELLADPLKADLFLAEQGQGNPFDSLFAIYLAIEDPRHGIFIKLPGEVQVNEQTGKQRIVFRDLPPLPFTFLKLNLKGGARSPLATPTVCGAFATTATNTPWSAPESGPPHLSGNSFAIDQGPGIPCAPSEAQRPFSIGLSAGSSNPVAGAHTPFTIRLTRADGNQELDRLEIAMPPGFVASLRGIPYCSEAQIVAAMHGQGRAEQANPSCPAASRVGSTNSAAGSGPSPFYAPGALYLAGPYKGAPLSVVAITPAVGGPFDLGNVVVRSALRIDPVTARITAQTDPLPRILKGVPLRIRDVRINLDRANWAQNPTSCEAMAVEVTAHGSNGAVSKPSNRFQVGNCAALGFKPRMNLRLIGGTKRGGHPSLHAVVRPRPGDANIKRAAVTLPRSAFLDQSNIRTICTRVQWANDNCPKAARYGFARAWSPLLDEPLQGPAYLRSSDNELPDLVADLRGPAHQPIRVEAAFRTDSVRGGIRSTIDLAPDAPVSRFVLRMQGGKRKGLIVNSQNLCSGTKRATARLAGHNGRRENSRPVVHAVNCKKQRKGAKQRGGKRSNLSQLKAVR